MADKAATAEHTPSVGRIVIYTSRAGIDQAAIITGLAADDGADAVHLHLFPAPGTGKDILDYEWGTAKGDTPGTWHWPERV